MDSTRDLQKLHLEVARCHRISYFITEELWNSGMNAGFTKASSKCWTSTIELDGIHDYRIIESVSFSSFYVFSFREEHQFA